MRIPLFKRVNFTRLCTVVFDWLVRCLEAVYVKRCRFSIGYLSFVLKIDISREGTFVDFQFNVCRSIVLCCVCSIIELWILIEIHVFEFEIFLFLHLKIYSSRVIGF